MLTNHFVRCAVSELQEIIDASEHDLSVWVHQNAKHFEDLQEFYPEENQCPKSFYVLDTQDRDTLFDAIGLYFVKERWPIYSTSENEYNEFISKLKIAFSRYDWKLKEDPVEKVA